MRRNPPADNRGLSAACLDALSTGVLVLDRDGNLVTSNPAASRLGLIRHRPASAPADTSHRAHPAVWALAKQVLSTGKSRESEIALPQVLGEVPTNICLNASLLERDYVLIESGDVTEAHRLARTRRDFVANVSHELKTPVGALRLLADALLDATDPADMAAGLSEPATIRRFAERIQHESSRLGRLVSELLELSRLLGAEPLPDPLPVSVDRIVAEVVDRSRTQAADKRISLRVTGCRGLVAKGNETQLVTALANLVENAIAYSPPDTSVLLTTQAAQDCLTIAVSDEGIGIEQKYLDRIFERFYRVDKARSRATGGTGLGLSIVKHIATNHGGQVEVRSEVGLGSTFTLRLPGGPGEEIPR
jgi:two-component system, OmpR family, sensor histidine kinase SenX3